MDLSSASADVHFHNTAIRAATAIANDYRQQIVVHDYYYSQK